MGAGNPAIYMEQQKVPSHQSNPKDKEHSWRYNDTWPQITLQSYSDKNSWIPA